MKKKLEHLIKNNRFFQFLYKLIAGTFINFIGLFIKQDENLILFTGQAGLINDSPLAIYKHIVNNQEFSKYKIIWAVNNPKQYPDFNTVKLDSMKYFKTALRARYWVASVNIERGLNFKKKRTKYLNTWHGIPIKTIGNAARGRKDYNFSKINYFVVSSEYEVPIYVRDFKIREQSIIRTGMPRNDELFIPLTSQNKEDIYKKLNIPRNKKIVLYAPTWRESADYSKNFNIEIPVDFKKWSMELGDDFVVLLRAHPYTNKILNVEFNDFLIDASKYPNINDLLRISEVLVTDYSAMFFDALAVKIKILMYPYDLQEYKNNRGIYLDYTTVFKNIIAEDETALLRMIKAEDYDYNLLELYKSKYLTYGGNSTSECVNILLNGK